MTEDKMLAKIRALLTKAEAEGCTPQEAEALTEKAAELMAKYGIDRALLAATRPETDKPADKKITLDNPYARVKASLLNGLALAMRCQCVRLAGKQDTVVHVFGYASDIERLEVLYTSLLLQMAHGLARAEMPGTRHVRAWRRSWMLGYISAATAKVRQAEQRAQHQAEAEQTGGTSTALVLADRSLVVQSNYRQAYPVTRTQRTTYTGTGYGSGYAKGREANIGGTGVGRRTAGALR